MNLKDKSMKKDIGFRYNTPEIKQKHLDLLRFKIKQLEKEITEFKEQLNISKDKIIEVLENNLHFKEQVKILENEFNAKEFKTATEVSIYQSHIDKLKYIAEQIAEEILK
ncbi:MAG: hypothetical protein FJW61_07565 [Actinobacteria bacterium]|nr:hypothetical protein [Actinomycetota bacterium]MBM3712643.1 hypothetical protein [Actinomycetota bacterium]